MQQVFEALLSERDKNGEIPWGPYLKWKGAHWVLVLLADLGYPPGDDSLIPLKNQVFDWLFSKSHTDYIKKITGKYRVHASQEGNALYSTLKLGLDDGRAAELAERLLLWQWPDGGWNCDDNPEAQHSSFTESLIPMRALNLFSMLTGSAEADASIQKASEVFLKRNLFKRQSDGKVINYDFTKLHYPCFWHYDILFGLKVMAESSFIEDPRCKDALDLLESKRLPDGGFPVEKIHYRINSSLVAWAEADKKKTNQFVTKEALYVLKKADRVS